MSPPSFDRRLGPSVTRRAARAVLSTQPDARLVALAREGSEGAFEEIVRRYRTALLRYGRSILEDGAEDAVQHAFLNAHRSLGRGDDVVDLRPWLYRLTRNAAIDVRRRQGPETSPLDVQIDGVEQPHDALMKREALGELLTRVGRLPRRQREALVLRELDGRGHEEIAELLGVSGGSVRQLIHRARGTLRSAAAFLVPPGLVERLAGSGSADHPARVAEIITGGAGLGALVVKGGTAVLATSAVVFGGIKMSGVPAGAPDHASAGVSVSRSAGTSARSAPAPRSAEWRRAATTESRSLTNQTPRDEVTRSSSAQVVKADPIDGERHISEQEDESSADLLASEPERDSDSSEQSTVPAAVGADDQEAHPAEETDVPEPPEDGDGAVSADADPAVSEETSKSDLAEAAVVEPLEDEHVEEPMD